MPQRHALLRPSPIPMALGRLVQVNHSGSVNNSVQTSYTQDKVDNRTNVTTTGA